MLAFSCNVVVVGGDSVHWSPSVDGIAFVFFFVVRIESRLKSFFKRV